MRILEAVLYADDLDAIERFYLKVFEMRPFVKETGRHVFYRLDGNMLLIFNAEASSQDHLPKDGIHIPNHGSTGSGHAALAIAEDQIDVWRNRLVERGVEIEQEIDWPNGGYSIYFRDPAGNSVELATPKLWGFE